MKKTNSVMVFLMIVSLITAGPVFAEGKKHGHGKDKDHFGMGGAGEKMFHKHFVSPEFIMRHQDDIGLTDEQKAYMKEQIQEAHAAFAGLEWDLQGAIDTMNNLMEKDAVDEKQILDQLDKVLDLENKIKRTRLTLVIRIKNKLTAEQLTALKEMKEKRKGKREQHGRVGRKHLPMQSPELSMPLS